VKISLIEVSKVQDFLRDNRRRPTLVHQQFEVAEMVACLQSPQSADLGSSQHRYRFLPLF